MVIINRGDDRRPQSGSEQSPRLRRPWCGAAKAIISPVISALVLGAALDRRR
jgi:hypothetical protein